MQVFWLELSQKIIARLLNKRIMNMKTKNGKKILSSVLEEVGKKLSALRRDMGYATLKEFAMDYKLPLIQYWRIENGKTNFTLKTLLGLLAIHKLSLDEFFCLTP